MVVVGGIVDDNLDGLEASLQLDGQHPTGRPGQGARLGCAEIKRAFGACQPLAVKLKIKLRASRVGSGHIPDEFCSRQRVLP